MLNIVCLKAGVWEAGRDGQVEGFQFDESLTAGRFTR